MLAFERMDVFIGLRNWQDAGVSVAINSDHMYGFDPNTSLNAYNMFQTMNIAVLRKTINGKVNAPGQRVSSQAALRMMTTDAAWLSFDEDKKGSIEVGKLGDLAMLSDDLMMVEENEIRNISFILTVVGGEVVYKAENADFYDTMPGL